MIHEDDDDNNWADPGLPSEGRSRPGDDNGNDDGKVEEDIQGSVKGIRKWKGTNDGKGKEKEKRKGKGKGNAKGKGIVKLYDADSDKEG
jgi:hypothetical protein